MIKTAIWTYFTALLSSRYLVLSTAWYHQLLYIINCWAAYLAIAVMVGDTADFFS